MAEPHGPKVRLKFKRIYNEYADRGEACLLPNGYRLATVEEIRNDFIIFNKWELPIKTTGHSFEERSVGDIHLLDGWMSAPRNFQLNESFCKCSWTAVVKKKEWDSGVKKWRNCSAFYSSNGFSLRKNLYDGINLSIEGMKAAWQYALMYEDVELLYWLWHNHQHTIKPAIFYEFVWLTDDQNPVRKMMTRLRYDELQMEMAREEAPIVLKSAIKRSRDLYGATWGLAMVELFIEVYEKTLVETAAAITFAKVESVPIFTKFLSLRLSQVKDQTDNIKPRFAEVLIEAVERGYTELVEKMLELFEDYITQLTPDDCVRALREAVAGGYIELVRSLLNLLKSRDGVALPVEVDNKGKTLFHHALFHAQVFQLLQQTYAALDDNVITRQDIFGRNILHWVVKLAFDSEVVHYILESVSSDMCIILCYQRDDRGRTPLHIAASKGQLGTILQLLDYFQDKERIKYIQETDSSGQTALQMAAGEGHEDSVQMLLKKGSDPLKERDSHRKTALHHAAQVKDPKVALVTCKALLHDRYLSSSQQSLLLWASATGIGTADEMKDVHPHVKDYLRSQKELYIKNNLLREAAVNNFAEMAWELLNRGADMADILDRDWRNGLNASQEESVKNVKGHIDRLKEQARDQPSMEDKLGRHVFAESLASLLLNRFIESPVTVGISGEWGMGKSSLMFQTEKILLMAAAQLTFPNLLPSEQFGGVKKISLSRRGGIIYHQIKKGVHKLLAVSKDKSQKENPLITMLKKYQPRYHAVYKSLACMDNNQMLKSKPVSQQQQQEHALRGVRRILTIRYNAWHYRNRHEAWAGLAVTITKEIENAMTRAQWISTCCRYTWAKHKVNIWMQVILPCLFSISLAGWVAWIVWMLLKQAKFQGLKYGSIPFTVIAIVWVVLKSFISVVKPVSTQMLGYINIPDHTSHLGYQENVIDDINFLKKELGKKPHRFFSFILGTWCWNWFGLYADNIENTKIPKFMPASEDQIRIVTFVDDLDRCEEKVILQVLSAVNLVLAECKINVILGIDKKMIERAIKRNFEDVDDDDLAEKFICKIIQIPLSLPDPTGQETNSFLEYHLGNKIPAKYNVSESPRGIVVAVKPSEGIEENVTRSQDNTAFNKEHGPGWRGIRTIKNAFDWLGRILGISTEGELSYDESFNPLRSGEGMMLISKLLLPNYTNEEASIFYELSKLASGSQKLPREWKRLLNYHKFAWYVVFRIGNIYNLSTWREELIGWIFVCWQWKREMNHLIKGWQKYTTELIAKQNKDRKQRRFLGPPLSEIVAECMDQLEILQSPVPKVSDTTERQDGFMKLRVSLKQDPSMKAILCLYRDNERINEEGTSQNNWRKLQQALKIRDVSMEAIQLFQQFRLYCETDHLPWS